MNINETNQDEYGAWPKDQQDDSIRIDPRLIEARKEYKTLHGSFEPVEIQFGIVEDEGEKYYLISSRFGPLCANNTDKGQVEGLLESVMADPKNKQAIYTLWEYPKRVVSLIKKP
jgi:hypothetical protein